MYRHLQEERSARQLVLADRHLSLLEVSAEGPVASHRQNQRVMEMRIHRK